MSFISDEFELAKKRSNKLLISLLVGAALFSLFFMLIVVPVVNKKHEERNIIRQEQCTQFCGPETQNWLTHVTSNDGCNTNRTILCTCADGRILEGL